VDGDYQPAIKVSNNPEKISDPGIKQVHRFYNGTGSPIADLLTTEEERVEAGRAYRFYHPRYPYKYMDVTGVRKVEALLAPVMRGGRIVTEFPSLSALQERTRANLRGLDATFRRLLNPHLYKVSLSEGLKDLKFRMIAEYSSKAGGT
jgi:nicotinate phosphoribosyltransferase